MSDKPITLEEVQRAVGKLTKCKYIMVAGKRKGTECGKTTYSTSDRPRCGLHKPAYLEKQKRRYKKVKYIPPSEEPRDPLEPSTKKI